MEKLTAGYKEFIKDKKLNKKGDGLFNKIIKKAATHKQRSAK